MMNEFDRQPKSKFNDIEGYRTATNNLLSAAYMWMTVGLAITGAVAFFAASSPALLRMIYGNFMISLVVMLAPIILVFAMAANLHKMSVGAATGLFALFSTLMGLSLSSIFIIYTSGQIASAFIASAGMFAAASIFGKITKQDLTSIGHFAMMAVWGVIIASIVNFFMRSSTLDYVLSYIVVVAFTALTAYDTQKIVQLQERIDPNDTTNRGRIAIMGALTLYMDFINIFLAMLRIMNRRN